MPLIRGLVMALLIGSGVAPLEAQMPKPAGPTLLLQVGHRRDVRSLAFSSDGRYLASAGERVILWNAPAERKVREFPGFQAAVSPDGKWLVTVDENLFENELPEYPLSIWDIDANRRVKTFSVRSADRTGGFRFLFLKSKPEVLVAGRGQVSLYALRTGTLVRPFPIPEFSERPWPYLAEIPVAVDAQEKRLLLYSSKLVEFDLQTGQRLRDHKVSPTQGVAYSADGKSLLVVSQDRENSQDKLRIRTLSAQDFAEQKVQSGSSYYTDPKGAHFSNAARCVAVATRSAVEWFDLSSGKTGYAPLPGLNAQLMSCAISPDGQRVLLGSSGGSDSNTLYLWEPARDTPEQRGARRFGTPVESGAPLVFSPDGSRFAASGRDKELIVRETATADLIRTFPVDSTSIDTQFMFSPDGLTIAIVGGIPGDNSNVLRFCDLETGQIRTDTMPGTHFPQIYSADGKLLVTASSEPGGETLHVRDVASGRDLWELPPLSSALKSAALRHDGRVLATAVGAPGGGAEVALWDVAKRKKLSVIDLNRFPRAAGGDPPLVFTVRFSPDGRTLALCEDVAVRIWDVGQGRLVGSLFRRSSGGVYALYQSADFSRGGERLIVPANLSDGRRVVDVWDVASQKIVQSYLGSEGRYFNNGSLLAVRDSQGLYRLSRAENTAELGRLLVYAGGREWLAVTPQGLFDGTPAARNQVTYRLGEGLEIAPVDQFFQDFSHPGLLPLLWKGEQPQPKLEFSKVAQLQPPGLKILSPEPGDSPARDVEVEVEATDRGSGLRGPFLRHNGAKLSAVGKPRARGQATVFTFVVGLVPGDNQLVAEASTEDGGRDSDPARLTLRYTAPAADAVDKPDLWVVAVGINKYAEESMNLKFAASDAEELARVFRDRGQSLYKQVNVQLLTDAQAGKAALRTAFRNLAAKSRPEDTLLVSLSGHGFTVGQRYYFVPHDFRNRAGDIEDDVRDFGYPGDEIATEMEAARALKRILILDTCNSGSALAKSPIRTRNPFAFRGAIQSLARNQGVFCIAASAGSEDAVEIPDLKHGVLTYALLAGLKAVDFGPLAATPVRPQRDDSVVSVLEWFNYAAEHSPQLSLKLGQHRQQIQVGATGSSFPLLPLAP